MSIAVIVLHYQNASDTQECLESLVQLNDSNYCIVLVDNGSQDPAIGVLLERFPSVLFLKNEDNLGYAEGNNRGIRYALEKGAKAVVLLNNDTIVSPDFLSAFREAAQKYPQAGAFGAKIYYYDDPAVLWHAGANVNPKTWRIYHYGCGELDVERRWEEEKEVGFACGCALFVRAETIREVGLMNPEYFLIWEEIDWCWRMRKAGLPVYYIPQARVWHKISQGFDGGNWGPLWQYYYFRNRLLFLKRNYSPSVRLRFYFTLLLKEVFQKICVFITSSSQSEKESNRFSLKGIRDYFLSRFYKYR